MDYEEARAILESRIRDVISAEGGIEDDELKDRLDFELTGDEFSYLDVGEKVRLNRDLFNSFKRFDILQDILEDDSVTEIMVNGYKDIFIEREGRIVRYDKSFSWVGKLEDVVQRIAAQSNKVVNEATPIIDTRLDDGSRVNIVMRPIAMDGPAVTIRKFYSTPLDMARLIGLGAITEEAADFLSALVKARYNIFISGGTGSGKTTFLNALSDFIPKDERIITIEDSAELKLLGVDNLVRMESRSANMEGKNGITIRDMIKASLRMRPSRIVVGEVRGGEAFDMIQAMNTGHDGSLSTGHANGPDEMMLRLESMVLMAVDMPVEAVRSQIASAIDIIVHLGRLKDGSRKVINISEVEGVEGKIRLGSLYEFAVTGTGEDGKIKGELKSTGKGLAHPQKLDGFLS